MKKITNFFKKYWIGLVILAGVIALDQITKAIIRGLDWTYDGGYQVPIVVIENFFRITYQTNTGGGWSILSDYTWLLIIITFFALAIFVYLLKEYNFKEYKFYTLGVVLMLSGTLGNFIDRLVLGEVTDFLSFIIFGYYFPTFNVADISLVVGAISLLVSLIIARESVFEDKNKKELKDENASNDANEEK